MTARVDSVEELTSSDLASTPTVSCAACDAPAAWFGRINCCGDTAYACGAHRAIEDDSWGRARATRAYFHPACGVPITRDIWIQWTRVSA